MINLSYLEAVTKALRMMEVSGMSTFGRTINADSAEVYAAILHGAQVGVEAIQKGALRLMREGGDFPSAGKMADVCKEIQASLDSDARNAALLALFEDRPVLEASTESGASEKWKSVAQEMRSEVGAKVLKEMHEPMEEEVEANRKLIQEQIERMRAGGE